jgi:Ca2+-binding RTX toxin-like protein
VANIRGTSGNDPLTGTEGDDLLEGLAGNDTLRGLGGNDTLDAGTGGDRLIGGTGNDTYIVDGPGDTVIEIAGEGIDTVRSSATRTLDANVENLTLTGTAAINGTGNSLNNVITGNTASNTLNGGTGADRLIGGAGNDTYIVDGPGDTVVENAGGGFDSMFSSASRTLDANVENLWLMGTASINGTGNSLNNNIQGTSGNNVLNGGTGADTLIGFRGDDTYVVDGPGDTVIEELGQGTDTVQSSATRTLEANVENLTLTGSAAINGTGNSLHNTITGNSAANRLAGGAGDDTYHVGAGDTVIENFGEGRDSVFSSVSRTLEANVEVLFLTGTAPINGTGNALNNVLIGNNAANRLSGADGNDTLRGGEGIDTMNGGLGNDEYEVTAGDVLSDPAGVDTVTTRISWSLGAGFENLTAFGTEGVSLTGNSGSNVISAFSGGNLMDGQGGNDTLNGATGSDTLRGGDGNDRLVGRSGNDSLTGGAGMDHFVFLDPPPFGGVDRITDFVRRSDELLFENAAFTALGASGAMADGDGRFRRVTDINTKTGQDSTDRLVYNSSTGSLYYDADGSGSGGSVLVATFAGNPTLSASDFTVI